MAATTPVQFVSGYMLDAATCSGHPNKKWLFLLYKAKTDTARVQHEYFRISQGK